MATSKIKGITIQIGGNTTGLDKALKGVNKTISGTQAELEGVNKALKLDPKNTELLEQKQRALAKSVQATADKLKTLKDAQTQAAEQLKRGDIGQEQYDALTREIVQTEDALKKAKQAAKDFDDQLKHVPTTLEKATEKMQDLSASADKVAAATKGVSIAGAAVVASIGAAAIKSAEWADELLTLSRQTGISTDQLQKMQYASELVDVSVESMTGALAKMTKQLGSTAGEEKFRALGVATRDASGALRDTEAIFYDALEALGRIGNETERDIAAMGLFGKSANELAGIVDDGGAALKAYGDEAERNGSIVQEDLVRSMSDFKDKIDEFKAAALPDLLKAGGAATEALTPQLETLADVLAGFLNIIGGINPALLQLILTLGIFAASLSPISHGISAVGTAIGALVSGKALASMTELMGTFGGKATAVVALLGLLVVLIVQIANAWGDMSGWEKAISVFGALVVAATAAAIALGAVQSAASMGIAAAAIVAGVVAITAAVNSATKRAEQNQLSQRNGIPMMANGGVLTRGSAIVGEAGPELLTMQGGRAVVQPLTNNYTTNYNTSSQPMQVNIQLDAQTLARVLVNPMRSQMQMAGGSSII